jgi:Arylsulfotransferase (ASST)
VWVDESLQVLVSFRHLSAIASIDGDPASPTFGEVHWVLSTPTSDWQSDFTIASNGGQADFFMQHNAFRLENGNLTFLDNRAVVAERSRVVEVRLDEEAGVATIEREWPLAVHCAFQGGAWRTAEGDPVATCAPIRQAWQLDAETGVAEWSATAECAAGFGTYIPRFVPLDW